MQQNFAFDSYGICLTLCGNKEGLWTRIAKDRESWKRAISCSGRTQNRMQQRFAFDSYGICLTLCGNKVCCGQG